MNTQLITVENTALSRISHRTTPVLFAGSDETETRFWEFFTAHIRNPNTRMAYLMAAYRFADWCETGGLALEQVKPIVVAAYIEQLTKTYAPPTVKQHLAAIRMLFDWLVVGQVVPFNPASSVRGPKHVVKTGKTPVLTAGETRGLLDAIDTGTLVGLRDRAVIGLMVYSFARVSAAWRCGWPTTTRKASARSSGYTKKAASTWWCRRTTSARRTLMNTSSAPASTATGRGRCFDRPDKGAGKMFYCAAQ